VVVCLWCCSCRVVFLCDLFVVFTPTYSQPRHRFRRALMARLRRRLYFVFTPTCVVVCLWCCSCRVVVCVTCFRCSHLPIHTCSQPRDRLRCPLLASLRRRLYFVLTPTCVVVSLWCCSCRVVVCVTCFSCSHLPVHSRATASAVRTWLAYADACFSCSHLPVGLPG